MEDIKSPLFILQNTFGFKEFRPGQAEIIDHVLASKDCLVIMPTGGGKSLCFQIPALVQDHLTIVVSPLIALMNDQVSALVQNNINAACYHSGMNPDEKNRVISSMNDGSLKLLYAAPETLMTESFLSMIRPVKIDLFAIDEAHCISVWGNDFRPEYVKLSRLKELYPDVNTIALTATADGATQDDICKKLQLQNPEKSLSSFERKNITIKVASGQQRFKQLERFLKPYKKESGIIYCLSRKGCEKLSEKLWGAGFRSDYYHAGLKPEERKRVQLAFQNDETKIICATIAFGMGIDKSNVRFVVHYNMPKNIEGYYQEIGRSGRDGLPAETLLFYSWADMTMLRSFIDDSPADATFKEVQYAKLDRIWEFANAPSCRFNLILNYFGEFRNQPCGHCDNCLHPPQVMDGTVIAQKALSAVIRSKEVMSINLLIDVLRGSGRREIFDIGLDQIKTYGAGRDIPFLDWKSYITQILNQGLLKIDYTDQSRLKITPLSMAVLKGERTVDLVRFVKDAEKAPKKLKTAGESIHDELFEILRVWRKGEASRRKVPPYVIFNDATLRDLCAKKPLFKDDLLEVDGIGDVKKTQYGDTIINLINDYIVSQNHKKSIKGKTYIDTLRLYERGNSPEEIAEARSLSINSIYGHFATLIEKGSKIDVDKLISTYDQDTISKQWIALGKPRELKQLYLALEEAYSYGILKVVIAMNQS